MTPVAMDANVMRPNGPFACSRLPVGTVVAMVVVVLMAAFLFLAVRGGRPHASRSRDRWSLAPVTWPGFPARFVVRQRRWKAGVSWSCPLAVLHPHHLGAGR